MSEERVPYRVAAPPPERMAVLILLRDGGTRTAVIEGSRAALAEHLGDAAEHFGSDALRIEGWAL